MPKILASFFQSPRAESYDMGFIGPRTYFGKTNGESGAIWSHSLSTWTGQTGDVPPSTGMLRGDPFLFVLSFTMETIMPSLLNVTSSLVRWRPSAGRKHAA
ncbi:hypothetical protein L596_026277 [Steinernema carpocapsae]|uniref:Uncharacterized protein n=1 Tax=Steinernema carpocapsae TaxID=34508 RepID=A0A4V5ZY47_STECR|nr:hypothetical protein L596_026277 [Steinernema carpocapsae]